MLGRVGRKSTGAIVPLCHLRGGSDIDRADSTDAGNIVGSGFCSVFFFQAEDGIRDRTVTGVQTCALPIFECADPGCNGHAMMCTDWEMSQAFRKWRKDYGPKWEEKFREKFEREMIERYDTSRSEERRVGKECKTRREGNHEREETKVRSRR